jgi:hypothetical protein
MLQVKSFVLAFLPGLKRPAREVQQEVFEMK